MGDPYEGDIYERLPPWMKKLHELAEKARISSATSASTAEPSTSSPRDSSEKEVMSPLSVLVASQSRQPLRSNLEGKE